MGVKGRDRDFARMQQVWQPLWKNKQPKIVSKEESLSLTALAISLNAPHGAIETIIDWQGNKGLRVKKRIGQECDIELHDYFTFAPVVFDAKGIIYVYQHGDDKRSLRGEALSAHIRETMLAKQRERGSWSKQA